MTQETINQLVGGAVFLPLAGLLIMTVLPKEWQNGWGFLAVVFGGIPGVVVLAGVIVAAPMVLIGGSVLLGLYAGLRNR